MKDIQVDIIDITGTNPDPIYTMAYKTNRPLAWVARNARLRAAYALNLNAADLKSRAFEAGDSEHSVYDQAA